MKNRVVHVNLSAESIDAAIKELKAYKKWILKCTKKLLKKMADEGMNTSSVKFSQAAYDGTNDVTVSVQSTKGDMKVAVIAVGNATLFIEFGTGVKYPDTHPDTAKNGMVRGGYGHGLGKLKNGWRYEGDPGTNGEVITSGKHEGMIHTYGNPANACMYETIRELEQRFEEMVREVFV